MVPPESPAKRTEYEEMLSLVNVTPRNVTRPFFHTVPLTIKKTLNTQTKMCTLLVAVDVHNLLHTHIEGILPVDAAVVTVGC